MLHRIAAAGLIGRRSANDVVAAPRLNRRSGGALVMAALIFQSFVTPLAVTLAGGVDGDPA